MRKLKSSSLLPLLFALVGGACLESKGTSTGSAKGGSSSISPASSGSGGQTSSSSGGATGRTVGGSGGWAGQSSSGGTGGGDVTSSGGTLAGRTGSGSTGGATSGGGTTGLGGTGGSGGSTGTATGGTGGGPRTGGTPSGGTGGTNASGGSAGTGGKVDAGPGEDAAGEAGVGDYLPCPTDGSACKVLAYGDSITQGFPFAAQGGYRAPLFHLALADKKKMTFIGSLQDGPDKVDNVTFPKNHEGHFAMTIEWLTSASNVPDKAIQPAHIVLLHAGTNNRSGQPADAAKKLEALIDRIISVAPNALLFVATILPCGDNGPEDAFVRAYDPLIPPIVEKRAKEGKHIKLVDQYTSFKPETMFSPPEKYHPNLVGYAHMADVWYAAIKSVLLP
jgi:hypothetical protein